MDKLDEVAIATLRYATGVTFMLYWSSLPILTIRGFAANRLKFSS